MKFREWYKERYKVDWKLGNPEEPMESCMRGLADRLIEFTEDCIKHQPTPNIPKKAQGH